MTTLRNLIPANPVTMVSSNVVGLVIFSAFFRACGTPYAEKVSRYHPGVL